MKELVLCGLIFSLLVVSGCAKKAETEKIDLDTDDALEESLTNALEEPAASQALPPALESMPSVSAEAPIPENPTSQQIQQALTNAGLYDGSIDGIIGSKTKRAIEEFQAQNNLSADGRVGPKTWAVLGPYLNRSPQPVATEVPATSPATQ